MIVALAGERSRIRFGAEANLRHHPTGDLHRFPAIRCDENQRQSRICVAVQRNRQDVRVSLCRGGPWTEESADEDVAQRAHEEHKRRSKLKQKFIRLMLLARVAGGVPLDAKLGNWAHLREQEVCKLDVHLARLLRKGKLLARNGIRGSMSLTLRGKALAV